MRSGRLFPLALIVGSLILLTISLTARAVPPATGHFQRTWERTDKPVQDLAVSRTWMWGPEAFTDALDEDYVEAPGTLRLVQYFDKSRMEDNSWRTTTPPWDVTNGLLVVEMMTGQLQVGDATFHQLQPAVVNVGGDADDPTGPTYATMALVRGAPPLADRQEIEWTLDRDGNIGQAPPIDTSAPVFAETYVPETNHRVASVFWSFMNSSGAIIEDGQLIGGQLFLNPYYATGFPVTEAYWAEIKVANTYKWVLLQCFERRCLTYTPDNPPGWRVEAGNVGQHYYSWRYSQQPPTSTPTASPTATQPSGPTATPTATATATMTASPTATQPQMPAPPAFEFSTSFGEPWDPATFMNRPRGIALDPTALDVYVADTNNHRIQKYNWNGVLLEQWGTQGGANGQFNGPGGLVVDQQGRLWVADTGNARIQIFDSAGQHLKTLTDVDTGGAILHSFQRPRDVEIDDLGNAWIVDSARNQLMRTKYDGTNGGVFSTQGTSANQLNAPMGLGIAPGNNVWVADTGNGLVKQFDSNGNFIAANGTYTTQPMDIAFDRDGSFWITDASTSIVYEGVSTSGAVQGQFGGPGPDLGQLQGPTAIAIDTSGPHDAWWIADTGNNRVQRFHPNGSPVGVWSDNRHGRYAFPSGIEWLDNYGLFIADTLLSRVQVVDASGEYTDSWGAGTTMLPGDPVLFLPVDIAIDSTGNVYVVDTGNNRIIKATETGSPLLTWGGPGSGPGLFNIPLSIALDGAGNIYVADGANHRIQKFDANGNYIKEWGGMGNVLGAFDTPSGLAISGSYLYVVDQGNSRIQRFDLDGNYTFVSWGSAGSGPGQFNAAADIAIGPDGNVYVADSQNHRIQAFTPDGQFLREWGSGPGNGPTQFNVPIDIAFDLANNVMYVTDRDNHRVQVLAIP